MEVCRKIREGTTRNYGKYASTEADERSRLNFGFDLETDEYMVKPFNPLKFSSHTVQSFLLRRMEIIDKATMVFET